MNPADKINVIEPIRGCWGNLDLEYWIYQVELYLLF